MLTPDSPSSSFVAFQPEYTAPSGGAAFMRRSVWSVFGSANTICIPPATCFLSALTAPEPQAVASWNQRLVMLEATCARPMQ